MLKNRGEGIFEKPKRIKFEGYVLKRVIQYSERKEHFRVIEIDGEKEFAIMDGI